MIPLNTLIPERLRCSMYCLVRSVTSGGEGSAVTRRPGCIPVRCVPPPPPPTPRLPNRKSLSNPLTTRSLCTRSRRPTLKQRGVINKSMFSRYISYTDARVVKSKQDYEDWVVTEDGRPPRTIAVSILSCICDP